MPQPTTGADLGNRTIDRLEPPRETDLAFGMLRITFAAAIIGLALSSSTSDARPRIDVPVMMGGEINLPACTGGGTVKGLDPNGDGFLSIMSGPGGRPFHEMDRVFNGQRVAICDRRGPWFAVVYSPGQSLEQCGVGDGVESRIPYTGPCRFGWAHSRYIGDLAGGI